ncbi:MAG TPA: FtsX-like permease family protein [Anaerolineales bacterium]|nr:FtsX-like permease family protein [Anaerolineales bacterium]
MKLFSSLFSLALQIWATAGIAFKRLLTQRSLSLASIAGLMIASGFILSVPLYADATYFRLLREELLVGRELDLVQKPVDYAPLSFVFEQKASGKNSPQWKNVEEVDEYLTGTALQTIDLRIMQLVRRFRTDGYFIYPPRDPSNPGTQYSLTTASFAFITPLEETVIVVNGTTPQPFVSLLSEGDALEAMASESLANEFGVQVGDTYSLRTESGQIPVYIAGLWRAVDPTAPYWDVKDASMLIVHEETYKGIISDRVGDELRSGIWNIIADGSSLHADDVATLQEHIRTIESRANSLLPQTTLSASPLEALARYQENAPTLTYLLFAFSVPILSLILAFIGLVAGLFVNQQRGEMAILRSRGASAAQVVGMSLLQGIILGAIALAGGTGLAYWITHSIGKARSFLDFSAAGGLRVSMTPQILGYGLLGIAIILIIQVLIPTLSAAENTIVTYKQERARSFRTSWWQRYWLDILLLIPAGYGLWQLTQQSQKALEGSEAIPDPLQNPLLLLVPALGIFSVALFTLRLVPRFMDFISRLLKPSKSVGMLMAARYLARTPALYSAPLVLLVLTLGLSAFTASLARTLDVQLDKQIQYQVGADMNIYELGTTFNDDNPNPVYTFGPVEDHLSIAGVESATRVGRYKFSASAETGSIEGTFLAIDRLTFPSAAYWQRDFASEQLGVLMNQLAANPTGVLVPDSLLTGQKLEIGDTLRLGVTTGVAGQSIALEAPIVGSFDLFPTWYPESGTMIVGNLEELTLRAGAEYPHEVWLGTRRDAEPDFIAYAVRGFSILLDQQADQSKLVQNGLNTIVKDWSSSELNIRAEQRRPERQGLFGLLSVGFVSSALLTVLGFLLYALFSFRRRFIEMGMLRAIGLSIQQMTSLLAAELAFLVLLGVGVGTALGVFASRLFVPFLQIGASAQSQYPPFQIEIAWLSIVEIYILFALLFVAALGTLSTLLVRMKIFQAIKLGETT